MAGQHFCKKCGKTMNDSEFYTSKNVEKYPPDGKMDICKKCLTIIGRYLSKMKLKQWSQYSWADTEALEEEQRMRKINQMKAQGMSGEEIENELATDRTPPKPKVLTEPQ